MDGGRDARWTLALVAVAACGRTGFDPVDGAAPPEPERLALPAGGEAWSVATTPADPAVVYAVVSGRLFRSDDRAATWVDCRVADLDEVLVDRADASILFAVGDGGLYQSTDRCATWTLLDSAPAWTLAFAGDDVIAGGFGLRRLRAGVVSPLPSPADDVFVSDVVAAGTTILAASPDVGVVRSTDGGTTFGLANTGLPVPPSVGGAAFPDPADPTRVLALAYNGAYYSTNGGVSWSAAANGSDGQGQIAADPGDPSFVLATAWNGILGSTDGGVTFDADNKRSANMSSAWTSDYAFDASGSGRAYAATYRGIYAADHGLAWDLSSNGIDAWQIYGLLRVPDRPVIYANTSAGVLRSDDDGATWALHSTGMEAAVSATSTTHIPVFAPEEVLVTGSAWLWRSTDAGDSFTEIVDAGAADEYTVTCVASAQPATLVYATRTQIYVSTNGGDSYTPRMLGGGRINEALIDPATGQWYATDDGVYAVLGTNVLADAEPIGELGETYTLAKASDGRILVGGAAGVFAGSGAAWTYVGLGDAGVNDLLVDGDRWIAASHDRGVFVSDDGGATWREVPGFADRHAYRLVLDSAGRLIVGTLGYGMLRVAL